MTTGTSTPSTDGAPKVQQGLANALRTAAMAYPGVEEHFPWGESAFKIKGKVFLFMHQGTEVFGLSCKLPESRHAALSLPFAEPTGYGLGKSGWVSSRFVGADAPPLELLLDWVDESFRAVAPKKVVAALPPR